MSNFKYPFDLTTDGKDYLADGVGHANPFAVGFESPMASFRQHEKSARVFHIRYDLWMALSGGSFEETGNYFRFEEMRDAQWPFDDITIMPSNCPRLPFDDNPNGFYQQRGIAFAKRKIVDGVFGVRCIDSYVTDLGNTVYDESHTFVGREAMSVPRFVTRSKLSDEVEMIQGRQVAANFCTFATFCDMLRHCGSIVELRHIVRDKKKRTSLDTVRKQDYRNVR